MTKRLGLDKPDFILRNRAGGVHTVFCKCCGTIIAQQRRRQFWRSRMYAEIKIRFADSTAHVTNICQNCIPILQRNPELLHQIYEADIADLCIDNPDMEMFLVDKDKPRIVAVDTKGRGIR